MDYIAYLHKDPKSDFGVSFPDFPGCITAGKTLEEAHRMAAEALTLHIAGMMEDGEAIPEPSTLDALANDRARKHAVAFLVHVEPAEKTVRINITARERQDQAIEPHAHAAGLNRAADIGPPPPLHVALPHAESKAAQRPPPTRRRCHA